MKRYRALTMYTCPVCGEISPRHGEPCLSDDPPGTRPSHEPRKYVRAELLEGAVAALTRLFDLELVASEARENENGQAAIREAQAIVDRHRGQ